MLCDLTQDEREDILEESSTMDLLKTLVEELQSGCKNVVFLEDSLIHDIRLYQAIFFLKLDIETLLKYKTYNLYILDYPENKIGELLFNEYKQLYYRLLNSTTKEEEDE